MKNLKTNDIRDLFLQYFKEQDHYILENKSVVPFNDKSILFINSGVATLKNYFNGTEVPPKNRLVNCQKAIRTNDIENVGVTSRHQTLFEMLGNFSIGDYFKEEAISFAFDFLTNEKWIDMDLNDLYFTVHPNDEVAYNTWIKLGVSEEKIVKTDDNFWEIGPGPGGPNTEIFFDRGVEYDNRDVRILLEKDLENDRVIEIWNLVFSEFNCDPGNKPRENYECLPQKNIDTGMGLERLASILQHAETNFETDIFLGIISEIEKISNIGYNDNKKAFRIISDHIRALTFAISDGALPSNDGRGYVLRRILRRAVKFGYLDLELNEPFLYKLVDTVINQMGSYYDYLKEHRDYVVKVIKIEEEKFFNTLEGGLKVFNKYVSENSNVIDGEFAFLLYDTYGFPIEITKELAEQNNLEVDEVGFEENLEAQRTRARNAQSSNEAITKQNSYLKQIDVNSEFVGYEKFEVKTKVNLITNLYGPMDEIEKGEVYIILEQTPFYAESGGQIGDTGFIGNNKVLDTIKLPNGQHAHKVNVEEKIVLNSEISACIDVKRREQIAKNHSATHLLHKGLHKIIGKNALQAGSLQDFDKTRFDFTNLEALTTQEITKIESYVNEQINQSNDVILKSMSYDEAINSGITALFGEKYGDEVRVVNIGESTELCGGTHVNNSSDIQYFHIISESGIGSGTRRIEAITGENFIKYHENILQEVSEEISTFNFDIENNKLVNTNNIEKIIFKLNRIKNVLDNGISDAIEKLEKIITKNAILKEKLEQEQNSKSNDIFKELCDKVVEKDDHLYIEEFVENIDIKKLREVSDQLINHFDDLILVLKLQEGNKVSIIVRVSDSLTSKYKAGDIIKNIIEPFNGRGGGKPNMAQGGYQIV